MIIKCKNCLPKEGIEKPKFTQSDKKILLNLKKEKPIFVVKLLIEKYRISHLEAKYIVTHINKKHGKCNRCDYNSLVGEYLNCPKCLALNFNWKIEI